MKLLPVFTVLLSVLSLVLAQKSELYSEEQADQQFYFVLRDNKGESKSEINNHENENSIKNYKKKERERENEKENVYENENEREKAKEKIFQLQSENKTEKDQDALHKALFFLNGPSSSLLL